MKVININPGLLPIPPNGWGAVEKIIWDYHTYMKSLGINSDIKYLDEISYDDSTIIHVHVANLANMLHERNIPYIFSIHDHHAYLYGKDSPVFKENLKAIENSIISLSPCKYLLPYFGSKKLRYFSHAVNTDVFINKNSTRSGLLCVANNGYAYDQTKDRKGFKIAIQAAMELDMPITIAGPTNNNKFFDTLEPEYNQYNKLTKLFDLDEKNLIDLYNKNKIFLHFSELEAGHPNLTLLEAMSCGLPVVGTFESTKYDGMKVTTRDLSDAVDGIREVLADYDSYQTAALDNANKNSYKNRVIELADIYSEYREAIFGNKLIESYNICEKNIKEPENKVAITFIDGPKVEILGPLPKKYKVKFINSETNALVYESILGNNMWASSNIKYFVRWKIEIYEIDDKNIETMAASYVFDAKNAEVKVVFDTESVGDLLAFIGAAEEFRKVHNCKMNCVVFSKVMREIFQDSYPEINFLPVDGDNHLYYAVYRMGYFEDWKNYMRNSPQRISLAHLSAHILGLGDVEYKPYIKFDKKKTSEKKYVCIFTQSTAQAKYWNNPDGWNTVVKYLKSKGYEVWCLDKDEVYGNGNNMNRIPVGVINKTGNHSLSERMNQIYNSEFCIGLSSGLSWLAWAVGKPVVLISGFTEAFNEFYNPYRVINTNVCNGCWNDTSIKFDKGDWMWCPRNKNFECSKQISASDVIDIINKIV